VQKMQPTGQSFNFVLFHRGLHSNVRRVLGPHQFHGRGLFAALFPSLGPGVVDALVGLGFDHAKIKFVGVSGLGLFLQDSNSSFLLAVVFRSLHVVFVFFQQPKTFASFGGLGTFFVRATLHCVAEGGHGWCGGGGGGGVVGFKVVVVVSLWCGEAENEQASFGKCVQCVWQGVGRFCQVGGVRVFGWWREWSRNRSRNI
jgi:hypothetical protein